MICIDNLSPEDLLLLTNAIAITLIDGKNADQINVLGNFVVGVGCLLLTVAAQQQVIDALQQAATDNQAANNNNNNNSNNN